MIDNNLNPYALLLIGIQRIDKTFFENLKKNVETNKYLELNSEDFFKNVKIFFEIKGWKYFFNLKENYIGSDKEIFYKKQIVESYRYLLLIMHKFKNNKKYSAEEMIVLFFKELFFERDIAKEYEIDYGICKTTKINDYCQLLKKEASQEILEQERIISAPKSEDKRFIRK